MTPMISIAPFDTAFKEVAASRSRGHWGALMGPFIKRSEFSDNDVCGKLTDKAAFLDFIIEVVKRIEGESGFKMPPRRWVVEASFGWMMRFRALVRNYERHIDVSEAMMHLAIGTILLRRLHT